MNTCILCVLSEESVLTFIGHFLWEDICLEELCLSKDLNDALMEGLAALTRREEVGTTVKEKQKTEMIQS